LKKLGVSGKKSVVYFYGADDAPSCKKQNAAFDEQFASFKKAGTTVVGVRNEKGAKGADVAQTLIVDEGDAIRKEIGIKKDLGLLGGRETYVIGKDGKVEYVFNSQFKPEDHVNNALEYIETTTATKKPAFSFFQK
jgi:peroxiredoxin Q/BCP